MFILQNATPEQKKDKNFVIKAVSRPCIITGKKYISNPAYDPVEAYMYNHRSATERSLVEDMRHNPGFTIDIVESELQFASEMFRDDKDVVLPAVHADGRAIQHASSRLQNDPEVQRVANRISWFDILIGMLCFASFITFALCPLFPILLAVSIACSLIGIGVITMKEFGFFSKAKYQQQLFEPVHNITVSLGSGNI